MYVIYIFIITPVVSLPPSFIKMPKKQAVFIPGEAIVLLCKVEAWPTPKYEFP